ELGESRDRRPWRLHVTEHSRVGVVATKRDDRFAEDFQQVIEAGAVSRKSVVEPIANLSRTYIRKQFGIAETVPVIGHQLDDRVTPGAKLIGRRIKHGGLYRLNLHWRRAISHIAHD